MDIIGQCHVLINLHILNRHLDSVLGFCFKFYRNEMYCISVIFKLCQDIRRATELDALFDTPDLVKCVRNIKEQEHVSRRLCYRHNGKHNKSKTSRTEL